MSFFSACLGLGIEENFFRRQLKYSNSFFSLRTSTRPSESLSFVRFEDSTSSLAASRERWSSFILQHDHPTLVGIFGFGVVDLVHHCSLLILVYCTSNREFGLITNNGTGLLLDRVGLLRFRWPFLKPTKPFCCCCAFVGSYRRTYSIVNKQRGASETKEIERTTKRNDHPSCYILSLPEY